LTYQNNLRVGLIGRKHSKIVGKKGIARADRIAQAYDRESNRPVTATTPYRL